MAEEIVLYYFDARGKAELIRLIFAYLGIKYTDKRFGEKGDAFIEFKNFKKEKKTPFEQVPILEMDNIIFAQSQAIVRYLSKKYKIGGDTDLDEFYADMIFCGVQDIHYKFNNTNLFKQNETTFLNEELPKWSGYFENILKKNKCHYFVGDNLTYADLAVFNLYDDIETKYPNSLKNFPLLKAHNEFISNLPNIKNYISNRKESVY
ncbi:glutathione S-transferase, putative [Plasmodium knowlesi strain H]|uniref:Glutathione S-transferase, putative n=3 Tax=Plasmodium knowlesi TaxID=5850 RepID=A0A5K1ULT2_PLAKH|nr:glutathione S-transferase, putative [Plasmodium knowlesi strain H]OTN67675.1 putative Glutathione S-transferase [Plasmodium knowlesi]CAA9990417.1 glutathione S-transferase, putative [Plasmodium knowlesi strain H]SBO19623.1 glutathione S-transferase, putative [Plasmodium knowlesi strain H]SBO22585.1 glutathione S-transferase, putative [Plasmodium knowlesi strain H]VVS79891.1 glutathione S-transferase, putative [Plasmodium knowlesi strain H]|eukprot:XP_002260817.1 glutathione s-transferase, putative [Plasmodium knowlesi strain H]